MTEWVDTSGHSTWIDIPQTEMNEDDSEDDIPEEADGQLFRISQQVDAEHDSSSSDESVWSRLLREPFSLSPLRLIFLYCRPIFLPGRPAVPIAFALRN